MKKQKIKGLIIRPAVSNDCIAMKNLINTHAAHGLMRPKSVNQLTTTLFHYIVAETDQTIIGVCGLKIWPIDGAEIISSAVRSEFHGIGVGIKLNRKIIKMISRRGFKKIFILTKQLGFYAKLGFKEMPKTALLYKTHGGLHQLSGKQIRQSKKNRLREHGHAAIFVVHPREGILYFPFFIFLKWGNKKMLCPPNVNLLFFQQFQ